uniref:Uncharacterized protein n=1 Tax=Octopus bimaculoides TaxID=37653 RepID=A0A0L8IED5_OCTBM
MRNCNIKMEGKRIINAEENGEKKCRKENKAKQGEKGEIDNEGMRKERCKGKDETDRRWKIEKYGEKQITDKERRKKTDIR